MRIVDREEFLKLPPNTIYAKYESYRFEKLQIKNETSIKLEEGVQDFWYQELFEVNAKDPIERSSILDTAENIDLIFGLGFNCEQKDSRSDNEKKYAIFDKTEIAGLIKRLAECI